MKENCKCMRCNIKKVLADENLITEERVKELIREATEVCEPKKGKKGEVATE